MAHCLLTIGVMSSRQKTEMGLDSGGHLELESGMVMDIGALILAVETAARRAAFYCMTPPAATEVEARIFCEDCGYSDSHWASVMEASKKAYASCIGA